MQGCQPAFISQIGAPMFEAWLSLPPATRRTLPRAYAFGFVAAYGVTAVVAYIWTIGSGGLAILWPCNGFLAAAFLLLSRRDAIATAVICAAMDGACSFWLAHGGAPRALIIAVCDLVEAFGAAVLMRRFCGAAVDLVSARRLLRMALYAALPASFFVGTVGSLLSHLLFGDAWGPLWLTWAFGDWLGMMVGAPAALIIARFPRYLRDDAAKPAESLAIVAGLSLIAAAQLVLYDQKDAFLIFPFMLLAAFRVSAPYSALAIVLVSTISAGLTIAGEGPFAGHAPGSSANLLGLQLFLACISVSTLIAQAWLTSLFLARRRAAKALGSARLATVRAKENAARLAESEARYRILAENSADIIQRVDTDYIIRYASPSIRRLGYEPEALVGRPAVSIIPPDQREAVLRRRDDLLLGKRPPPSELTVMAASGERVWMESSVAPIHDQAGRVAGVVNVLRDITERKAAETAMRKLNNELQRVARVSALGAFASSVGHEINQPLAAIATNSETALRWLSRVPPDVDQAREALRRTQRDALRTSEIVSRLRSMVTNDAPTKVRFDVRGAIREVLDLTDSRRAQTSVSLSQTLGRSPVWLMGDRIQIQQVVMNLVLNAIESMQEVPADERRLSVGLKTLSDGIIEITVGDTGPGVSAEARQKMFESLFTTKIGGTGLGLPISRSIVSAHGGTLDVENAAPRGAVFKVRLPSGEPDEVEAPAASSTRFQDGPAG